MRIAAITAYNLHLNELLQVVVSCNDSDTWKDVLMRKDVYLKLGFDDAMINWVLELADSTLEEIKVMLFDCDIGFEITFFDTLT